MFYIGIDLAWTYKNETGICIIDEAKKCVFLDSNVYSDEDLVDMIRTYGPSTVSIDAPLQIKNETGGRLCDSLLMKHKIHNRYLKLYATSRSYMLRSFNAIRGESIYSLLKKENYILGRNLTETYPTGVFLSLMPDLYENKYKISSRLSLDELKVHAKGLIKRLELIGFKDINIELSSIKTKKAYKHTEDMLDAVLCAVNSYYFHHKKCISFHADDNGYISLPM